MNAVNCKSRTNSSLKALWTVLVPVIFTAIIIAITSCKTKGRSPSDISQTKETTTSRDTIEHIKIERKWRIDNEGLDNFIVYSKEDCNYVKQYFESRVSFDEDEWPLDGEGTPFGVGSFEHYSAIKDLLALYYDTLLVSFKTPSLFITENDYMALWRLDMLYHIDNDKGLTLDQPRCTPCDYNYEGLRILKLQIDSVLHYDPFSNFDIGERCFLEVKLNELFVNVLYDRLLSNYRSEDVYSRAAEEHYNSFLEYRKACHESAMACLNPTANLPITFCSSGIDIENLNLQAFSLIYEVINYNPTQEYLSFPGLYPLENTIRIGEKYIDKEYLRLIASQEEDDMWEEDSPYRMKPVAERKQLIEKEQRAWKLWLKYHRRLLDLISSDDNNISSRANSLILKHKWRMLNNQYHEVDMNSGDVESQLLKDNCTVNQLKRNCFSERWNEYERSFYEVSNK